jgi:hypothetical protein
MKYPANTDQNAPCTGIIHEGYLLGIEETQRLFRFKMIAEAVEQRLLIVSVLYPLCLKPQIGLSFRLYVKPVGFAKFLHGLPEHPSERKCRSGVGRVT